MTIPHIFKAGLMGLSFCLLSVGMAPRAQAQEGGFGERLGAQLDQGLDRLGDELQQGWASLRETVDKMGVQGRVYSRLRWDKRLVDSEIDVEVGEGGVVALRGRISDAEAKQKAIQLAKETVGVNRVVDDLRVEASAKTEEASP